MEQNSVYALIKDGVVKNTIVGIYYNCDKMAKLSYGPDAQAVEIWSLFYPATAQIQVSIGDKYEHGRFYRYNHETLEYDEILPIPTADEQISSLNTTTHDTNVAVDDIIVSLLEGGFNV